MAGGGRTCNAYVYQMKARRQRIMRACVFYESAQRLMQANPLPPPIIMNAVKLEIKLNLSICYCNPLFEACFKFLPDISA